MALAAALGLWIGIGIGFVAGTSWRFKEGVQ